MIPVEHTGLKRCLVAIIREHIPSSKDQVIQLRERHKILYQGNPILEPFAQANGSHLGQRTNGKRKSLAHCFNACQKRGAHRTSYSRDKDSQFALWLLDLIFAFHVNLDSMSFCGNASPWAGKRMEYILNNVRWQ